MIKVAVIGLGWWGRNILKNILNSTVITPVMAVDPIDQARTTASTLGVKTALRFEDALANPDVDAVILCTPQEHHAGQIVAAARSGRHVFCEKPLCTTAADAETAIAAVRAAGVQLGIGHERRFEPAVIEMRRRFCFRRIRQSAAAGRQFQPGQIPEVAPRELAIFEWRESGWTALRHGHPHGGSINSAARPADPCLGAAGKAWERFC
jgi:hypothetical protein